MIGRGRWPAGAIAALLTAVLLAGCTVLATDPTIRPGLDVGRDAPDRDLQVAPPGPRPDSSPEQIVRDFIQALAASGGDFVSAREFLAEEAVDTWSPESRTVILRRTVSITEIDPATIDDPDPDSAEPDTAEPDAVDTDAVEPDTAEPDAVETDAVETDAVDTDAIETETETEAETEAETDAIDTETGPVAPPLPELSDDDVVLRLAATAWAEVDRDGHFRELPEDQTITSDIVLTEEAGQWRIRHLEEGFGRWLATSDFERVFDAYAVHYVSRSDRLLVPDIRYIPTDRVATRLAQLQLAAAPDYLSLAVRHDLPSGTRLAVGAVPIVGGVATVDLSGQGFGADPEIRRRVWAQFVATLSEIPQVDRVQITFEGSPLEIPGVERVRTLTDLGFATTVATGSRSSPLIRQDAFLRQFTPRPLTEDSPPQEPPPPVADGFPAIEEEWQDLALSLTGAELAGVSGTTVSRWRNHFRYEVPAFAENLGRPCYDSQDILWLGGEGRLLRDRLFFVNAAASPVDLLRSRATPVEAGWLAERRVVACHVSPQGTRIAIISDAGEGSSPRLDIGSIVREVNGLPTAVVGPQRVAVAFELVTDAVWLSEVSLAVLGQTRANAALIAAAEDATPEPADEPAEEPDAESPDEEGGAADEPDEEPVDPLMGERGVLPYLITVGGRTSPLPQLVAPQRITTTGGERNLIITRAGDEVYLRVGSQWLPAQEQGREVVVGAR